MFKVIILKVYLCIFSNGKALLIIKHYLLLLQEEKGAVLSLNRYICEIFNNFKILF